MSYPDPCAECGGTRVHRPWTEEGGFDQGAEWCPALDRGAGTRRHECGSRFVGNRNWLCAKAKGHSANDPFCAGTFAEWGYREWLYQDAEHWPSRERAPSGWPQVPRPAGS